MSAEPPNSEDSQPAAVERELGLLLRAGFRLVVVESFEEERALRLIERVAGRLEREAHTWSLSAGLDGTGAGEGSLDAGQRAGAELTKPAVITILDAHEVLADPLGRRRLRDQLPLLAKRRQTLILLAPVLELPLELEREAGRIELPLPAAPEIRSLFERVAESARIQKIPTETLDACVRAALGLTGAEAVRVFRKAALASGQIGDATITLMVADKQKALRRTPALSFHDTDLDLGSVGGLGELKRWLRERQRAFGDEARRFGLPTPRGLLLLGVQGCGKSLCAKAVAREWRFPLLHLDLSAAFADPVKGPEVTIREATAMAESVAPAVLWIDEIEKGFAATETDPHASRVFGSFLTWLAEKKAPVFVTATANDVTALPPELLRRGRFDDLFFVDLPNVQERVEILSIHLTRHGRDPAQFPLEDLAELAARLSGAEIEQVVAAALYTAFGEDRELSENDLANAIQETVPLYETYEERIKELRNWARHRARRATLDAKMVNLFEDRAAD